MFRLENPTRAYAWGSASHIPRLCGLPETETPVAEMWLGAHPGDPSRLDDGTSLAEAIRSDPDMMLGAAVRDSFGDRLPYLMKLLAAREPLSLQVHPTSERARIRFAEQNAAGIPLNAAERSYQDPSHKPELIYALTRFEGLAGFRNTTKTAEILRRLRLPWLDEFADRIGTSRTPFQTLRAVTSEMLAMAGDHLAARLQELRAAAMRAEKASHRPPARMRPEWVDPSDVDRESIRVYAAIVPLIDRYPTDPGVLVTLLLNHVVLAAGEAMYLDAGIIHAYTSGFGVEIMASSDNVLRAGLTPKHVDVPELLAIANFTPTPPPLWGATTLDDATGLLLSPPVEEFELLLSTPRDRTIEGLPAGPQIVLCVDGSATVATEQAQTVLRRGESVFVPAAQGTVTLSGRGRAALARPPI
jgi:mannose-6-phosphate isomerase